MNSGKIATVVCAAVLVLTGCGSNVQGKPADAPASTMDPEPTVARTSKVPVASPAGGDSSLTPTGTTLPVRQTATVLYATKSLSKQSTKLAVTAVSVKKGSIDDLKNFKLDAQTKVSVPFYITMKFRNLGPKSMDPGGIFGLIEPHNTAGDPLNRLSLLGEFKPCDGTPPKQLAVGASFTECDVYIAPAGQNIGNVVFGFYLGDADRTEITWTVG
jgi:hypothetical protein